MTGYRPVSISLEKDKGKDKGSGPNIQHFLILDYFARFSYMIIQSSSSCHMLGLAPLSSFPSSRLVLLR
jgi:hypothetical protein